MEPTVKEYITITRINHESGNERGGIELMGRFIIDLSNNAFSGTNGEDTVKHVEKFLKIADSLNDPGDTKFKNWLASKFMSYKIMDGCTKNALWNYWKKGNDQEVMTNQELSDSENGNLNEEEVIAQNFRIDTNIFHFETPLCKAFKEFNYLLGIDADVLTKDILGFKTYGEYKDDWIYKWNEKKP
ncbi:hypothetical protein Tco_0843776 [Tanacetum coccineum]